MQLKDVKQRLGIPQWKRWAVLGAFAMVLVSAGWGQLLFTLSPSETTEDADATEVVVAGTGFVLSTENITVLLGEDREVKPTASTALSVTFVMPADLLEDPGPILVQVQNDGISTSNALTFTINPAPTISYAIPPTGTVGVAYGPLSPNTSGGTGELGNFRITGGNLPTGLTIDPASGAISGTPTVANTFNFQVSADDSATPTPATAVTDVTIVIDPAPALPTVGMLTPSSATAGDGNTELTVAGTNFVNGSVVVFGSTDLATVFGSASSLTATIPAGLLATATTVNVTVRNPGNRVSNSQTFTINAPAPAPTISNLNPNSAVAGAGDTQMVVTGTNFSDAVVLFGAAVLAPSSASATTLTVNIPAAQLTTPGTVQVKVRNGDDQESGDLPFTIGQPPPSISNLNPNSVVAGAGNTQMVVTGTNFNGATVLFGTEPLTPTSSSPTSLTVTIPSAQLASAGTVQVKVRNGDNQESGTLPFTIGQPAPTISNLNPNTAVAGTGNTQMVVTGTNFAGATVLFGAEPLTPTTSSPMSLTVTVPSALLASPGTIQVRVRNGDNQESAALPFTISTPPPTISNLNPNSAVAGDGDREMVVTGTNFSGAVVLFGTTPLLPTISSPTELTVTIPAAQLASERTVPVRVRNGDNQESGELPFAVNLPPPPVVSGIDLTEITSSSNPVSLTIAGSNFRSGAVVLLGTSELPPDSLSSTQIAVTIPGSLQIGGVRQVSVRNPQPGGQTSGSVPLTIKPTISALEDVDGNAFGPAGSAGFELDIRGTGFSSTPGENEVTFGGETVVVVSRGFNLLVVSIPSTAVASPGPKPVIVRTNGVPATPFSYTVIGDTTINITNESNLGTTTSGIAYSVDLEATGGNGNYTWSVAQGSTLPPGINLNSSTGVLSGTPNQPGTFTFTIGVVDNADPGQSTGQKSFTLIVEQFLISTTSLPQARVGIGYSAQLALSGAPTTPPGDYEWALISPPNSIPGGLTFDTATGRISGTPSPISSPSQNFSIQVSARHIPSGLTTPVRNLTLTVSGGGLDISVSSLPVGAVLEAYGPGGQGATITPVNGTPPYTINLTNPSQVALEAAGFAITTRQNAPNASLTIASRRDQLGNVVGPSISGTFQVEVVVRDAAGTQVQRNLTLIVLPESLRIQPETLPSAALNVEYRQQLTLSGISAQEQQGSPVVTWSLLTSVPGLTLGNTSGELVGTFTTPGQRTFTVLARTNLREITRILTLNVETAKPVITTSTLPVATIGQSYSAEIEATGGTPGYTWQVAGVTLPEGLSFDAGSVTSPTLRITGTPAPNAQSRTFQITVRDSASETATREFTLNVSATPIPAITLQPFQNPVPAEQKDVVVTLAQAYPVALSGTVSLSFTPNATNNTDDPQVQFVTGGRTARFTIPANETQAVFSGVSAQRVQTGTVAGTIRVEAALDGGGPTTLQEFSIARTAPFIQDSLTLQSTSGGFTVTLTAYSTARDLTNLQVTFTPTAGTNLGTTQLTIPLTDAATQWFQSSAGQQNGSAFRLTVPFTVQNGSNAVSAVTVTLTNSAGTSNSRTRSF